jgi:hypothetical protein
MDPFDMLKESFDMLTTKVDKLLEIVFGLKVHVQIIWTLMVIFISGTAGTFFYVIKTLLSMHLGG